MERTNTIIGPSFEGIRRDWIGDHLSEITTSITHHLTIDRRSDGMIPLFGPEFFVRHDAYESVSPGISAMFPETEHFRAKEYTNWIPADLESKALNHLPIVDLKMSYGLLAGTMSQDKANAYSTVLCAQTNPGRAEVSLPSEIGEALQDLRKLPGEIYQKGLRKFRKEPPEHGLDSAGVYFGILPLVSDVVKFMRFSQLADQRAIELSNLANKHGARVKKTLFRGLDRLSLPASEFDDVDFASSFPDATLDIVTRCHVWGVTHWLPGADAFNFVNEKGEVNRRLISGLFSGVSAYKDKVGYLRDAWELVPWSWAADWCGNFGDYLDAYANTNIATFDKTFIMMEMSTRRTVTCSKGSVTYVTTTRERCEGHPSLALRIPFLSAQKLSILADIARKHGSISPKHSAGGGHGPLG